MEIDLVQITGRLYIRPLLSEVGTIRAAAIAHDLLAQTLDGRV